MNYGLYLSASGVLASSQRQDVIANNLANSETVGFKRDLPVFQSRLTEAQQRRLPPGLSNPALEPLGGGMILARTAIDTTQGDLQPTDNPLDLAIIGNGYFTVSDQGQTRLTRDGRFLVNQDGQLVLANAQAQRVLDTRGKPITVESASTVQIDDDGLVTQDGQPLARLAVVDVPRPDLLTKQGEGLLDYPNAGSLPAGQATLRSGCVENANVDPAAELAALMDSQRQLEANANMIRYQDQALARLVNDVGKIS